MNPAVLFWIPASLRLLLLTIAASVTAVFFGPAVGLAFASLALALFLFLQLSYLYRLGRWLDDPVGSRLPDGWGAWSDIFSRLYKLRRDDERNQAELA
ncbi:protein of unknown function, partial [Noviherbaspirillum humi]